MDNENLNDVSSNEEQQSVQENTGQSIANQGTQRVANAGADKLKKKITEKATKQASKAAIKKGAMMALSHVIFYVSIFIIAIVVLIGIAMFFVTMPGMIMEKLKALGKVIGNAWASWFGDDSTTQMESKQIYEVMDYVEEMGYGLKEHGFLTHYLELGDAQSTKKVVYEGEDITHEDIPDSEAMVEYDEDQGVFRSSETGQIVAGVSEFITQYIVSDNYMYTIRNYNLTTSWWKAIFKHLAALFSDDMSDRRGMILLLHEGGSVGTTGTNIWGQEDAYDASERGYIKIDPQSEKMIIKKGWISAVELKYDLNGWTGRYGMPLEFLLSVHAATLMPDLAYDMTKHFDTNVRILLHETKNDSVIANYKTEGGGFITQPEIQDVMDTGLFSGLSFTEEEAARVINLGIVPPNHGKDKCTCVYGDGETYKYEDVNGDFGEAGEIVLVYKSGDKYTYKDDAGKTQTFPSDKAGELELLSSGEQVTKAKDQCYDYIKAVATVMNEQTTKKFSTYTPYIESVRNHWYRDVYFVVPEGSGLSFVRNDYDYEALMKERWTKYERWGDKPGETVPDGLAGKYKLYKVTTDASGNYSESNTPETSPDVYKAYENTRNQGDDVEIKYVKHAETLDLASEYKDLYWTKSGNVYLAYTTDPAKQSSMDKMFDDDTIKNETDDLKKYAMEHIYAKLTTDVITQVGDGLRAETNTEIKKMFLTNKYFRYDGNADRAEQITQFREEQNIGYGPLSEADLAKTISYKNKNDISTTIKASDISGSVQITQDSLNAFSMLENTHTLDADFIYRDFKELIVELGFFTKEELMDSIPKVMEFPVPDLGSYGYPLRILDKNTHEKGTMMHSKKDYDAIIKEQLVVTYMATQGDDEGVESGAEEVGILNPRNTSADLDMNVPLTESQVRDVVGAMGSNWERIPEKGDGYEYKVKNGSVEYTHYYQFSGSYAEKTFTWSGSTKTIHRAACGPTSCVNLATGYGVDCNPTNDIVGLNFEATIPGCAKFFEDLTGVTSQTDFSESEYASKMHEAFSEGKPCIVLVQASKGPDTFWTSGGHFVACVGEDSSGNLITVDSGSSNPERHTYSKGVEGIVQYMVGLMIPDEPPAGKKPEAKPYEGYKGNEAVVSPISGILLDYGVYKDSDKIETTTQTEEGEVKKETYEYRENVDLNYGVDSTLIEGTMDDENEEVSSQRTTDATEKEKIVDKVGYAKILALKPEHIKKLGSASSSWSANDLVVLGDGVAAFPNQLFNSDTLGDWDPEKTMVYAFKEFAENYQEYGIGGFTLYIDGFVCELPEEVEKEEDESKDETYKTRFDGEDLSFSTFKAQSLSAVKSESADTELIQSMYLPDDAMQLASKSATERVNAESECKSSAYPVVNASGLVFIKEGTVIGRTMSDIEANDATAGGIKIRKNPEHEFEYYRKEDDEDKKDDDKQEIKVNDNGEIIYDGDKVIGNYLRFLFYDTNNELVENVEDYMKLDELVSSSKECEFEQLAYYLGCLEEGFYQSGDHGTTYGVEVLNDGAGNTTAFGLTKAVAELPAVKEQFPNFESHLAVGEVPKEEAQDVFILVLEAAKETIESKANKQLEDLYLFALIDLSHASPSECYQVIDIFNANGKLTVQDFENHWGTNMNYAAGLSRRGHNRGILATEGRWLLYQKGSEGDEVIFDTDTPWTQFCDGGGTYELTRESSGFYHIEKGADKWDCPYD